MKAKVELSVIVPVYNVEPYVRRCIMSILEQTYPVGEIICVDDGSTDNSLKILKEIAKENANIRIIHKENGGLVSAKKAGLSVAKGKYATYVDSDDWIEKDMYEVMMKNIVKYDADIVTSGCIRDYNSYCVIEEEKIYPGVYEGDRLIEEVCMKMIDTEVFYRSNISIHSVTKIFRRTLLERNQFNISDDVNIAEDAACVYPAMLNAKSVVVTGRNFYHYCMRNDSIMGRKKINEWEKYQILFSELEKKLSMHEKEVPNIMEQFKMLKIYVTMLRYPEKFVFISDNILYPYGEIRKKDNLIIYGKGRFGVELNNLIKEEKYCEIADWIDKKTLAGMKPVNYLDNLDYDKIVIAVLIYDVAKEIYDELIKEGIESEKILMIDAGLLYLA